LLSDTKSHPLKSTPAGAASLWHVLFKLPLHTALDLATLTGQVSADGKSAPLMQKAATGADLPASGAPLTIVSAVTRKDGPLAGGHLIIVKGRGLSGATAVHLGTAVCGAVAVFSDHLLGCTSPAVTAPAAGVTVTITTANGEARLQGAYSFVANSANECDAAATLSSMQASGSGATAEDPLGVCNRAQLFDALSRFATRMGPEMRLYQAAALYLMLAACGIAKGNARRPGPSPRSGRRPRSRRRLAVLFFRTQSEARRHERSPGPAGRRHSTPVTRSASSRISPVPFSRLRMVLT
jgi:hypothetical protein